MSNALINNDIYQSETTNFYSINGTGNNQTNTNYGSVGSTFLNTAPLDFGDGISSPAGADRPNPRVISNTLAQQDGNIQSDRGLTNLIWVFGQFLDHDITATPENRAVRIEIPVPTGDPFLDPNSTGTVNISLNGTAFVDGTGTSTDNPAQIINTITAWVDGSNIYGSSETTADSLRAGNGGLLTVSEGDLLPFAPPNPNRPGNSFTAGDGRVNENSALVAMHTLFVREHNRIAGELAIAHPDWTDAQLYERARQINIAQYQAVVYREYLPSLLGIDALPEYNGYDAKINPNLENTFSSAAFRVGHTQLGSQILRLDTEGQEIPEGSLTLSEVFFRSAEIITQTGIDPILRGIASSLSENVDLKIINDIRNLLFSFGGTNTARDLFAINIQRGRLNGISDYNTVREAFGLAKVTSFADITSNVELQTQLASLYGNVDNIDLYVALLAEDHVAGAAVGETFQALVARQFVALRDGDRFYYENIFNPEEIAEIENATLAEIIRRNTDTRIIQDKAFSLLNEGTANSEKLNGGLGNDSIFGGDGDDTIIGFQGNDLLSGDAGNDFILGVDGRNILEGDDGNDVYQLNLNAFGSEIKDSAGLDSLFITSEDINLNSLNPADPSSFGTLEITLGDPTTATIGLAKVGNDLIIDLNRDGVANADNDLKIIDFFNAAGEAGTGFVETINNLVGTQIVDYFTSDPVDPSAPNLQLAKVHRFYQYQKGFHLYTSDMTEIADIQAKSQTGELAYNYEAEKFNVLSSDQDALTGADIAGAEEVYRFFNTQTGAHLYTMDEVEKSYIENNLSNYNYEGIKFYAFEDAPQDIETLPVFRMLNSQSGSHLFTVDQVEIDYIQNNLPHFSLEGNNGVAFYVVEL
jgi:peroxidase